MSQPDPQDPHQKANNSSQRINQTVEKGETLVNTLAQLLDELISTRSWKRRMVILSAFFAVLLNPPVVEKAIGFFKEEVELPSQYLYVFWSLVLIPLLIAVIAAVRELQAKRRLRPTTNYSDRSAIKGLQPFEQEDHEIFKNLGRDQIIRDTKEAIERDSYSIGVLIGLSGSGKTSFLRAGLMSALQDREGQRVIYVQLSERPPVESVSEGIDAAYGFDLAESPFHALIQIHNAESLQDHTIILFLDQFEQLYTHKRSEKDLKAFYEELKNCYQNELGLKVKVLIAIRSDFQYHLFDLQQSLDFSLQANVNQNYFDLPLFREQEAAHVLQVMIEKDGFTPDPGFLKEICRKELANEAGEVSAVDIQVMAKMISKNFGHDPQAFSQSNYESMGGIDGIWEQFLRSELDSVSLFNRNQNSLKVLLAFVDLENNVRAGFLTLEQLKHKLAGSVETDLQKLLDHLQQVRLITRDSAKEQTDRYQLAHERLIMPLRIYANHEGVPSLKATQLLDRRTNEWLANRRDPRYLLPRREYRLIRQNKKALSFGKNPQEKDEYINKSGKKLQIRALWSTLSAVTLVLAGLWFGRSMLHHFEAEKLLEAANGSEISSNPSARLLKLDSAAVWHWDKEVVFQAYLKEISNLNRFIQSIPFYHSAFELGTNQDTLVSLLMDYSYSSALQSQNLYNLGMAASRLRCLPAEIPIPDSIEVDSMIQACLKWQSYETVTDLLWVWNRDPDKSAQVQELAQRVLTEIEDQDQWHKTREQLHELAGTLNNQKNPYPSPAMVNVAGGTFMMGDVVEGEYKSTVSDFAIGKYEVTVGQYVDFLNQQQFHPEDSAFRSYLDTDHLQVFYQDTAWAWAAGQEAFPIAEVSRHGATAYAAWLTEVSQDSFSLPTEAQWEYAAGGGRGGRDSAGLRKNRYSGSDSINSVGWVITNSMGSSHPIGLLQANELGLYDMSGNLWEWCYDWIDGYPSEPRTDYSGPESGDYRVYRGGSWGGREGLARVSSRPYWYAGSKLFLLGFRLARLP